MIINHNKLKIQNTTQHNKIYKTQQSKTKYIKKYGFYLVCFWVLLFYLNYLGFLILFKLFGFSYFI